MLKYNKKDDRVLKSVGNTPPLSDNTHLVVEIRQYKELSPRLAVFHYKHGKLINKLPRLRAVDALELAELITYGAEILAKHYDKH